MKKYNLVTFSFLFLLVVATVAFMFFRNKPTDLSDTLTSNNTQAEVFNTLVGSSEYAEVGYQPDRNTPNSEIASTSIKFEMPSNSNISMEDALFIGDSRTVGLMEYAGIDGADYFCTVGMSVYNIHKEPVSVPNVGEVTLTDLLNSKKYGKIYIMLGINEVGYNFGSTVEKYAELIEFIKSKQTDATIFVQANLHVTKSRSDSDEVINNTAIDGLNEKLSKLADGKNVFYLNANVLFDDDTGSLSSEKTEDSTHLYAKYYKEWGSWIVMQTFLLTGEG